MNFSFRPHEKLKNKADIQFIFDNGIRHLHYPILFFTATFPDTSTPVRSPERGTALRLGFSVPKKKFKRAVDRNRIKRLMRECTRLQKHRLYNHLPKCDSSHLGIMMVYIGHKIPDYSVIFDAVSQFTLQYAKSLSE